VGEGLGLGLGSGSGCGCVCVCVSVCVRVCPCVALRVSQIFNMSGVRVKISTPPARWEGGAGLVGGDVVVGG
jgi:hypothetical protein